MRAVHGSIKEIASIRNPALCLSELEQQPRQPTRSTEID
jgi:hypothetical protein